METPTHKFDERYCPVCTHPVDAAKATDPDHDDRPHKGDYAMCQYCGAVLKFIDDDCNVELIDWDEFKTAMILAGNIADLRAAVAFRENLYSNKKRN